MNKDQLKLFTAQRTIKFSSKWLSKSVGCNLRGIENRCGGVCCTKAGFWPPKASPNNICVHLGPNGCTLAPDKKPLVCQLFPIILNANDTAILWGRTLIPKRCCNAQSNKTEEMGYGSTVVEDLQQNLTDIFGEEVVSEIIKAVKSGRDYAITPSQEFWERLEREKQMELSNQIPPA